MFVTGLQAKMQAQIQAQAASGSKRGDDTNGNVPAAGGPVAPAYVPDDPYTIEEPADVLGKMPSEFYKKIEEKKWSERRDALEALHKIVDQPRLKLGDYNELLKVRALIVYENAPIYRPSNSLNSHRWHLISTKYIYLNQFEMTLFGGWHRVLL